MVLDVLILLTSVYLPVPTSSAPQEVPYSDSQSSSSQHDHDVVNTPIDLDVFDFIQQDDLPSSADAKKRKRRGTFGSISRYLFPKSRTRRVLNATPYEGQYI